MLHGGIADAADALRIRFPGKSLGVVEINQCITSAMYALRTPEGAKTIMKAWDKSELLGLWGGKHFEPMVHSSANDLAATKDPDSRPSMPPGEVVVGMGANKSWYTELRGTHCMDMMCRSVRILLCYVGMNVWLSGLLTDAMQWLQHCKMWERSP